MRVIATDTSTDPRAVRGVIDRFMVETQRRAEPRGTQDRRDEERIHRTWPLVVRIANGHHEVRLSAALYNASSHGIAFLAPLPVTVGTRIEIQLFWHDDNSTRVPAIVRHCEAHLNHQLIGCEFILDAEAA